MSAPKQIKYQGQTYILASLHQDLTKLRDLKNKRDALWSKARTIMPDFPKLNDATAKKEKCPKLK